MQSGGLRAVAIVAMMALGACAGGDLDGIGSAGAPPSGAATERARLLLVDRCMFDVGATASAEQKIVPTCQCYARGALRQMSPFEINSVAGGGSIRSSVRSSEIYATCTRSADAFAEAAPRSRARRSAGSTPQSRPAQTSDDETKPE